MKSIPSCLVATLFTLTSALAHAQIKLEFAWPDGLQATVTHTKSRIRTGSSAAPASSSTTVSYDMKASRRQDATIVTYSNARLDSKLTPQSLTELERKQLEVLTTAALPAYLIKHAGDFDRIDDPKAFRTALMTLLGQSLTALGNDPKFRNMIEQVTTDGILNAAASAEWSQLVGFWVGATLDVGETYTTEYQGANPLNPAQKIRMMSTFKVNEPVACNRGGLVKKCVEIEMRTDPNKSDLADAVKVITQKLLPHDANMPIEIIDAMDVEQNLILITEADGLIPHKVSTRKRTTVTTRTGEGSKTASVVQDSVMHYVYR